MTRRPLDMLGALVLCSVVGQRHCRLQLRLLQQLEVSTGHTAVRSSRNPAIR